MKWNFYQFWCFFSFFILLVSIIQFYADNSAFTVAPKCLFQTYLI